MTTESDISPGTNGDDSPVLSFVVPAYNEERMIAETIASIHRSIQNELTYEITVVDNGSTDATPRLAVESGAAVLSQPGGTIGALRNLGARSSRGAVLVFLDADVSLTPHWKEAIGDTLTRLQEHPRALTGAMCTIPSDATWLERTWFGTRSGSAFSHIGTGHMLLNRRFFQELGGFDESLATGEDYDLSRRGVAAGGVILPDPRLVAEHRGFPRTLGQFFRREIWHGRSDFLSLRALFSSPVALTAVLFAALHLLLGWALARSSLFLAALSIAAIAALCLASSIRKYRGQPLRIVLANGGIFYVYYAARALSALGAIGTTRSSRSPRVAAAPE